MSSAIGRILVPIDFSATSDRALEYARALAQTVGASLELLHVIEDPLLVQGLVSEAYLTSAPPSRTALLREARAQLGQRAKDGENWEAVFGHGASAIVDYATDRNVDLIVMGTHGRTGIAHAMIGSVAERVVRTASCPVLTLKQATVTADEPQMAADVAGLSLARAANE